MKHVEVVAGLILKDGRVLVCQRKANGTFPLKWEFPGGKVEAAEKHEQALRRELNEELGIQVEQLTKIYRHEHEYSKEFSVTLKFYQVQSYAGEIQNLAFKQLRWAAIDDLRDIDFLAADLPLINRLVCTGGLNLLV